AAGADVAVARAKAAAAEADLDAAKAETLIARRELEELDVLIDYAEIKAPFDAVVTERMAEPGNLVLGTADAGRGEPLFVVSRVDRVRVHVPVPEADAAFIDRGDTLTLRLPSFEGEGEIETTVTRVGRALDPNTRTMLVEAELENADGKYLPGMFGEATITLGERPAVAVLPARAVRFGESGDAYVYALGADDVVRVVGVTTGVDEGARIEIDAGVVPGDRVVDAHLERLTDGEAVTVLAD
ncbi:MAG: efflux RND transporter periplasmic adaptor subunit, partial [Planctomycetota bacterium]